MKKNIITLLTTLSTGLCFGSDQNVDQNAQRLTAPVYERRPERLSAPHLEPKKSTSLADAISAGIEKAPEAVEYLTTLADKVPNAAEKIAVAVDTLMPKTSYVYVRMNVSDSSPGNANQFSPGVGLGYRRAAGSGAIDLSASYTRSGGRHDNKKSEQIILPRIAYLYYFSPIQSQSLYVGPGIAAGQIRSAGGNLFQGLIPSIQVGYEFSRKKSMLTFAQLEVSQPALAARRSGDFPGPIAEFAVGAGF